MAKDEGDLHGLQTANLKNWGLTFQYAQMASLTGSGWKGLTAAGRPEKELSEREVADGVGACEQSL